MRLINHRFWILFSFIILISLDLSIEDLDADERDDPVDQDDTKEEKLDEKLDKNKPEHARSTNYSEDRFSRLFNPRNTNRKRVIEVKHNAKPKPTLPSFIKKTPSIRPISFTTVSSRNLITQAPVTKPSTKAVTSKPNARTKPKQTSSSRNVASTTSSTEAPKRKFAVNKRNNTNRFTSRNRN